MAGLTRILALGAADLLASYSMFMLITYLTDVWELGFVQAAAVINVFWGLVSVLPLFLMFMSRSIGNRFVVTTTSIAYSVGLVLLTMSTPPVLGNALGTCTAFESRCIGQPQRILFYIGVPLIALGMAGQKNSLESFLPDQMVDVVDALESVVPGDESDENQAAAMNFMQVFGLKTLAICCGNTEMFIASIVAVFVLPYFSSWSVRFGVPAAFTLIVTFIFLLGLPSYNFPTKSAGSTVREDEGTKKMVRMIPVCITLILCGVVSAIGWAFFAEQLGHLNPKVGSLKVSTGLILWFHEHTKDQFKHSSIQMIAAVSQSGSTSVHAVTGVSTSMIGAILCTMVAALVEHRRLGVVQNHGIVDGMVPMTMFWLLPQFFLLGKFIGMFKSSAESLFKRRFPKTASSYLPLFVEALYGIGTLCSVGVVYLVGKVSENGGHKNWFQDSLNASRLDKYFWTLSWLMTINFLVYLVAGIRYSLSQPEDAVGEQNEADRLKEALLSLADA